jgi:diacylglycerol kinase family enzyme
MPSPGSSSTASVATRRRADVATTLIVNPYASRVTPELAERVARELGATTTVFTERAGHATELAREADTDAVVVFSGDGGFNEALNGARPETLLGFVPGGGTSVLPRALGLPRDPVEAARRLSEGRTRRISLGRANGRRFAFAAGVGLDAELIRRVDALGRREDGKRPGDVAFARTALRTLAEHRVRFEPALEIVGHGRAAFALVANADPYSYVGRLPLRLARGADLEGGLDLLAPRSFRARSLPGAVRYLATGRTRLPLVQLHDADRIVIRCDAPMPLQLDGEDLGDVAEVVLEAERDAVAVLA